MIRIHITQEGHRPEVRTFDQNEITVGRSANCDLVLSAPGISGVHARFLATVGDCVVIDENSTNGTYLHGERIASPTPVAPHDEIYICKYAMRVEHVASHAVAEQQAQRITAPNPTVMAAGGQSVPMPAGMPAPLPPPELASNHEPALVRRNDPEMAAEPLPQTADEPVSAPNPVSKPPPAPPTQAPNGSSAAEILGKAKAVAKRKSPPKQSPRPRSKTLFEKSPPTLSQAAANVLRSTVAPSQAQSETKGAPQEISAQTGSHALANSPHAHEPMDIRSWPVPEAPDSATNTEHQLLSRIFARMAQPYIERGQLPPGDQAARSGFYALAQTQLSTNLSASSSPVEAGAERIVQALCAIGPLGETMANGFHTQAGQILQVQGTQPFELTTHPDKEPKLLSDLQFCHPWALRFAIWRLIGRDLGPREVVDHLRLSNGVVLSAMGSSACLGGPFLQLAAPTQVQESWASFCESVKLSSEAASLLDAVAGSGYPIIVCEQSGGKGSLWRALLCATQTKLRVTHIEWPKQVSRHPGIRQLCADQDPHRQARLAQVAAATPNCQVLAIDRPHEPLLNKLKMQPGSRKPARWYRLDQPDMAKACAFVDSIYTSRLSSTSATRQGVEPPPIYLAIATTRKGPRGRLAITEIAELSPRLQDQCEAHAIFEGQGSNLKFVGEESKIYADLARRGIELAPGL